MMKTCMAPIFSASNFLFCIFMLLGMYVVLALLALLYVVTRSPTILCIIKQLQFRMSHCHTGNSDPTINLFFDLDAWLAAYPAIRNAIRWESADRGLISYDEWSSAEKEQLAAACRGVRRAEDSGLPEVPPLDVFPDDGNAIWSTNLSAYQAWRYYLAYIAQSIMADARGWFAWSLHDYSATELASLFDSRYLFTYRSDTGKYAITRIQNNPDTAEFDHGACTPGDPGRTFAFLYNNNILAANQRQTIENLMDWCRPRLVHFNGGYVPDNQVDHWQFGGYPPVERIISGTVRTSSPEYGVQHWTAGCWGTTAFLRLVLRTANIPLRNVRLRCPLYVFHSAPHFQSENLYLSHGDDLYGKYNHATPPIPSADYLIDQATFDHWFGAAVSEEQSCNNVGRQSRELALQYLPNGLLRIHCSDLADGRSHANSRVYAVFNREYTVAELEAAGLWSRLDAKIAGFGGCDNIPETPGLYGG